LQIIRIYAQSEPACNGLDATQLADSGIGDWMIRRHSLID